MEINQKENLTEEEMKKLRSERFGNPDASSLNTFEATKLLDEEKKKIIERQKRFGIINDPENNTINKEGLPNLENPDLESDKKKRRAARFGLVPDEDTLKKRAVRFGLVPDEDKLKKRAERFGLVPDEAKLKKRAERFGLVPDEDKLIKRAERFKGQLDHSDQNESNPKRFKNNRRFRFRGNLRLNSNRGRRFLIDRPRGLERRNNLNRNNNKNVVSNIQSGRKIEVLARGNKRLRGGRSRANRRRGFNN